jgi:hypothetical protein
VLGINVARPHGELQVAGTGPGPYLNMEPLSGITETYQAAINMSTSRQFTDKGFSNSQKGWHIVAKGDQYATAASGMLRRRRSRYTSTAKTRSGAQRLVRRVPFALAPSRTTLENSS